MTVEMKMDGRILVRSMVDQRKSLRNHVAKRLKKEMFPIDVTIVRSMKKLACVKSVSKIRITQAMNGYKVIL